MRIRDWSSEVCSSDLPRLRQAALAGAALLAASAVVVGSLACLAPHPDRNVLRDHIVPPLDLRAHPSPLTLSRHLSATLEEETPFTVQGLPDGAREIGRASCRYRVCQYV